ncbi:RNA polymerase sigma factor [Mastigocoleus sp. MO_188.B34]|uniref:RNA polymerase sigma factor n=1 Tax=Mastigocoleus sp. MO_188.B34 TaxID=3036635 RepID=UPI00260D140C|nr:RNA polymerase sigma factor [Mastigocoleus sp. MO_188.B34]MDJ0697677.1 RNA polymerase sigma factor [Mastigocoleus sp. MO_188.B34]
MVNNQMVAIPETFNPNDFWQSWQEYRDYLYARCLKWMGGNSMEAENALSRAMLKAWEKMQQYAGKITNLKAWLTRLTHNLCVDIHREHNRGANRVEDIEAIPEEKALVSFEDTPFRVLEIEEKKMAIRGAIDNLPIRLRETFILHFYHQLSHQEITEKQEIAYANVCKRISQARKILREQLRKHFIEENETDNEKSNQTEDVQIESSTSISVVGDKNQKEALSYQSSANVHPENLDERVKM